MAYPDLQTLFNNGMGSFAAIQAGQQQADAQQSQQAEMAKQAAALQAQQLANQQSQVMNPLDAMFRQGQVNQQAATLPGLQAQSQSLQAAANVDQATQASKIAATISDNQDKIGDSGMKQMGRGAQIARQAAAALAQVPVMMRPQALESILSQYGSDPNAAFMKTFTNLPPDKMPDLINTIGQGMAQASDKYITETALEKQKTESASKVAGIQAAAHIKAAQIQEEGASKRQQALLESRADIASGKLSTDQKIAALSSIPADQRTSDQNTQLEQLSRQRIAERAAMANQVPAAVLGQPSPSAGAQAASPFVAPQAPVAPTTITAPPGMKMVGTSGGKPVYEDAQGKRFILGQ